MNIQSLLLFITASVNSLLSLMVLFGRRDKTNVVYAIFVLFASMWAIGLAFFILETDLIRSLYIANFYYIAAAGIPTFFLYFSIVFLDLDQKNNNWLHLIIVTPLILITILFFVDRNFIIKDVFATEWGKDVVLNRLNYILYSIYFFIFVILSYIKLFDTFSKRQDINEKNQLKFILWGTIVGFIFGMIFDLILPFFGDYRHIFIGPLFSFSMVASIAYSITRHHLFNMKVIATEILMFILWVFIFIRAIVSNNVEDQVINIGLLAVTIFIGIFLIRSVIKEVRQREQIEKLAEDLRVANQGQANLMHFMNHQVKGRLGNIKNIFAELMTDDYGAMPDDSKPLLRKGLDEADIGVNYVQNILKGASAENGTLPYDMRSINFKDIVEDTVSKQKEYASAKNLTLNSNIESGEYSITGDSVQLGEAIKNLIDNSINYTPSGSIDVNLSQHQNKVVLRIKDTGVGILSQDMPKLFKSGGRGTDSLKININSTGYGLAFVKGVIEAHKGRVWAESLGEGKGSTFVVELPR